MESSSNGNYKAQEVQQSTNSFESKQEIDGELVLRDVMQGICQCLNINDLSRVAQVCKSWKEEASREIDKRYLQLNILHGSLNKSPSFHVSKILSNKPHVTLLFPGTGSAYIDIIDYTSFIPYSPFNKDDSDDVELEYDIIKSYRKHFPNKLIVVGVFESMVNANLIRSTPLVYYNDVLERCIPSRTASLSLPLNKHLNIKESYIFKSEFDEHPKAKFNDMIKNLLADNTETKSAILIFIANPDYTFDFRDPVLTRMLKKIKSRLAGKSYTMWGFVTSQKIFASNKYNKDANSNEEKEARIVGLNLSGPNFDSWSTVISVKITKAQLKEKLNSFKEKIHLKRCSIGFITAPIIIDKPRRVCYSNSRELVSYIKAVFPEVPFLGTFCEDQDLYFGIDLKTEDANNILNHEIISIMILSYD